MRIELWRYRKKEIIDILSLVTHYNIHYNERKKVRDLSALEVNKPISIH